MDEENEDRNDFNDGIQSIRPPRHQRQKTRKKSTIFFNELTKKTKFFISNIFFHLKLFFDLE